MRQELATSNRTSQKAIAPHKEDVLAKDVHRGIAAKETKSLAVCALPSCRNRRAQGLLEIGIPKKT